MLKKAAHAVRRAGRFGDTELVHLNRRELGYLARAFGEPSVNPQTGLPEFFDFGGILSQVLAPIIGSAIGAGPIGDLIGNVVDVGDWGQTIGGAVAGAGTSGLFNGFNAQNLLTGAGLGAATPTVANTLGFSSYQNPFNIPQLFDVPSIWGGGAAGAMKAMSTGNSYDGIGELIDKQGLSPAAGAASGNGAAGAVAAAGKPDWLSRNPWAIPTALGALTLLSQKDGAQTQTSSNQPSGPPNTKPQSWTNYQFPQQEFQRKQKKDTNVQRVPGEYVFFEDNKLPAVPIAVAKGGSIAAAGRATKPAAQLLQEPQTGALNQGFVRGPGDGRADKIAANLSNDEFVMDAETTALFGNGSPAAGAAKFEEFRRNLRKHKGKALAKGRFSPNAKPTVEGYLSRAA